ncbi:hypothetical protein GMOD_00007928 [Pyrenophora seminiperda CCB06]|uniref:Uncharacterized protein n=1 Tax=Pyrenophora seminiperda CCB06 TaxID=1302712 RepID=A0A3M7MG15_9PLEO|nr:hypothetical protein GMOD_00007928 [Pyrenophora seminiperda CCB06]
MTMTISMAISMAIFTPKRHQSWIFGWAMPNTERMRLLMLRLPRATKSQKHMCNPSNNVRVVGSVSPMWAQLYYVVLSTGVKHFMAGP